jgi:Protein of unknown function (DUF2971)
MAYAGDMSPRVESLLADLPKQLFKYSAISGDHLGWMKSLVIDSQLYFAKPSSFNDPFECRIPPSFVATESTIKRHWTQVARRNDPHITSKQLRMNVHRMFLSSRSAAGRKRLTDRIFASLDDSGIACFSTDPRSMLMWSYYSEKHEGVAVRFNMDILNVAKMPRPYLIFPVHYESALPTYNYYKSDTMDMLRTALSTKAEAWAHENEWRIVLPNHVGLLAMPYEMIDGVVLGVRTTPSAEAHVRTWAAQRADAGRPIEILRVSNIPDTFDLRLGPA